VHGACNNIIKVKQTTEVKWKLECYLSQLSINITKWKY